MDNKKLIGYRINSALALRNMKQKELAEKLGFSKKNANTISFWCSGSRTPNTTQIIQIAEILNVSADYLLGLTNAATTEKDLQAVCDYTGLSDKTIKFFNQNNPKNTVKYNTPKKTIIDFIEYLICEYKNGISISDEMYDLLEITKKAKDFSSEFSSMSDEEVFKDKNKVFREYRKIITNLTDKAYEKKYRSFELFQHLINAYIVNRCDCSLDSIEETVSERQLKLPNSKKIVKALRVPLADNEIEFRIAGEDNE